ncbi:integrase core domain-containing protein [Roseobacteraceae bacterium S113]
MGLAWRISNTPQAGSCVEAMNDVIVKVGVPEITNTAQGWQLPSFIWAVRLRRSGFRIFMDWKSRLLTAIFVKRLWRSSKDECVYLHAQETGSDALAGIAKWVKLDNHRRPHSDHSNKTIAVVCRLETQDMQPKQRV